MLAVLGRREGVIPRGSGQNGWACEHAQTSGRRQILPWARPTTWSRAPTQFRTSTCSIRCCLSQRLRRTIRSRWSLSAQAGGTARGWGIRSGAKREELPTSGSRGRPDPYRLAGKAHARQQGFGRSHSPNSRAGYEHKPCSFCIGYPAGCYRQSIPADTAVQERRAVASEVWSTIETGGSKARPGRLPPAGHHWGFIKTRLLARRTPRK